MNTEENKQSFNLNAFLELQKNTRSIVENVSRHVEQGMSFLDIETLIVDEYTKVGIEKSWHPTKVRIDEDTVLSFSQKSSPKLKIKPGSIYFIDIGTVRNDLEGDYGKSFVFGESSEKQIICDHCEMVFKQTVEAWRDKKLTGKELYEFAASAATDLGLVLNLKMDGHRLGSFPHGVFYKGGVANLDFSPSPSLWILEVQVMSPTLNVGAFFEDLIR